MVGMTDNSTRKKHTGEPGNKGEFGSKEHTEGDVILASDDEVTEHLRTVCAEAGMDSMMGAFAMLREKGFSLDNEDLMKVTAAEVTEFYDDYFYPVLAQLELRIDDSTRKLRRFLRGE